MVHRFLVFLQIMVVSIIFIFTINPFSYAGNPTDNSGKIQESLSYFGMGMQDEKQVTTVNMQNKNRFAGFKEKWINAPTIVSIVIGSNISMAKTTVIGQSQNVSTNADPRAGIYLGTLSTRLLDKQWGIRSGVLFSFERIDFNEAPGMWLAFFRIPVLGKYSVSQNLSFNGGINFDTWLFEYTSNEFVFSDKSTTRWFNPGLSLDVEYNLTKKITVSAGYFAGLNNMISPDYRDMGSSKIRLKKSSLTFGVNFLLY